MPQPPNPTTEAVHEFINAFAAEYGISPSIEEIAAHCYLALSTVLRHLDRLEATGRISRIPGKSRSIRLVKKEER